MLVGDGTQIIYNYRGTWSNRVAPAPLIDVCGDIESPYRGLGWFTERDAAFFFGRDSAIDDVLQRLSHCVQQPEVFLMSGVSGAGKSSLLRAGVLPRIRGEGLAGAAHAHAWPRLVLTPGRTPVDELALGTARLAKLDAVTMRRELREDPTAFALIAAQAASAANTENTGHPDRLLLVIDQFEQLFTRCPDEAQRQAFVTALYAAATVTRADTGAPAALVMLVVRADFEARCADYEQLGPAIQSRYLVTAMTERQLRMAITEPARKAGSHVDDDLCDQLLDEIRTHIHDSTAPTAATVSTAGVLPLLSHALDRAWRAHTGDTLTLTDYERSGGMETAVADSAEHAYDSLTPPQKELARKVFTRLTITGSDGTDTADRVAREELAQLDGATADLDAVLEAFAAERLLTLGAGTVEISHEIVFTTWPLLRDIWLAQTRHNRALCSRLRIAATEWDRQSRDPAYLYSGSVLENAETVIDEVRADPTRYVPLGSVEKQFLAASLNAERRRNRQRRAILALLLTLVVALTATTLVALRFSRISERQRDIAVANQLISQSQLLFATDPFGSRLSAVAAWRINPTPETRHAMLVAARNPQIAKLTGHIGPVYEVVFSPDGRRLATAGGDGTVWLWDAVTYQPIGEPLTDHTEGVTSVMFSPDGRTLTTAGSNGTVRSWDAVTHEPIGKPLIDNTESVNWVTFSPDRRMLATANFDRTVRLWDAVTHQPIGKPLTDHIDGISSMAFSHDSRMLATASTDDTVSLWDMATQQPIGEPLTGHTAIVNSLTFSPDGRTLATGGMDGAVRLWDAVTHQPIGEPLTGHTASIYSIAFSPDGRTLAAGGANGAVRLWDAVTHQPIGEPLTGHTASVNSVTFSPDGRMLATTSIDSTARLWDVATHQPIGEPLTGHTEGIKSVTFSPDGRMLATASRDSTARLWDTVNHQPVDEPLTSHTEGVNSVTFSPDGRMLATAGWDGTARLWDTINHQPIGEPLIEYTGIVNSVAFSPDSRTLATTRWDGIRLWDVATHQPIDEPLTGHTEGVNSVTFSPDGHMLAAAGIDRTVRLWDTINHQPIGKPLIGHTQGVNSVTFSPDGQMLATASWDGTARLWDTINHQPIDEPLTSHTQGVNSVAFSPDGRTLATASDDHTVRLWDVVTRQPIGDPFTSHTRGVNSVAFSPDGRTVATASDDRTVRLWDVGFTVDVASVLCTWAQGTFTRDQWNRYVPSAPAYRQLCP